MKEHEIDDRGLAPGDQAIPGAPGTGENVCPMCRGGGSIPTGEICPTCLGSGKITEGLGGG